MKQSVFYGRKPPECGPYTLYNRCVSLNIKNEQFHIFTVGVCDKYLCISNFNKGYYCFIHYEWSNFLSVDMIYLHVLLLNAEQSPKTAIVEMKGRKNSSWCYEAQSLHVIYSLIKYRGPF